MFLTVNGVDQSVPRSPGSDLLAYNQLVLQHQDEAFTLACDLLGDEILAAQAVEEVFRDAFGDGCGSQPQFRLEILKKVVTGCLKRAKVLPGPETLAHLLAGLTNAEKVILVLVDCLELSYADAGRVLGKQPDAVRQALAKARYEVNAAIR